MENDKTTNHSSSAEVTGSTSRNQCFLNNLNLRYINDELQLQNECLTQNMSEIMNQLKEKCSKVNELEVKIKNNNEWKKITKLELQKCNLALEKLTNLYNEIATFVHTLIEKKTKLTKRITEMDAVINLAKNQIIISEKESVQNSESNIELKKINGNLMLEIQDLTNKVTELENINKDNFKTLQGNEKILSNLKNEKDQIHSKNRSLNDSIQGVTKELKQQSIEIEKLKNEIKEKNSRISSLEKENYNFNKENNNSSYYKHFSKNNNNIRLPTATNKNQSETTLIKPINNKNSKSPNENVISGDSDESDDQENLSIHQRMDISAAQVQFTKFSRH